MTNDHSRDADHGSPPDRAAAGDVSTTGHSALDVGHDTSRAAVDSHVPPHDAQGVTHAGHADDTSDRPTLVPTTWRQLALPILILLLVAFLLAGPIGNAFAPRPAAPPTTQEGGATGGEEHGTEPEAGATPAGEETGPTPAASPTAGSQPSPTGPAGTPTAAGQLPGVMATQTAVSEAGERGAVTRAPVRLDFGGAAFEVKPGSGLLPDWQPPQEPGTAMWIDGTYANHILYLPYSPENGALFERARAGDTLKVTMNTGQVFFFAVTRAERALNGPPTQSGQFTVTTAMAQDHAGVTLFLVGDPAADRAVVQAEFTGTIQ